MNWIISNDYNATILTETKLRPILAIFNSSKYQKNYTSHWTIDPVHTKGSGVAIITKKNMIGNHIYKQHTIKGRCIMIYCKFKGKKMITITGIYGSVAHNPESKKTIQTIINHLYTLLDNEGIYHIILGDFNEDSSKHIQTPILEALSITGKVNLTKFLNPEAYT